MPEVLEQVQTQNHPRRTENYYPSSTDDKEIIYPEQREDDTGETSLHYKLISYLWNSLSLFMREREDVSVAANMNLYYEQGKPQNYYTPDVMIIFGVSNQERKTYKLWEENVFPQVIFEIASGRTWDNDIGKKYRDYESFGVEEYYILDPEFAYLPAPLMAFHRQGERLLTEPVNDDRIFSPRLGLEMVRTENAFRLFNPNTNQFLLTLDEAQKAHREAEIRAQTAEAENEKLKAEIKKLKSQK